MNKRSTLIVVSIGAFLVIPLAIWVVTLISQQGTVNVPLLVLPKDATVKIGDRDFTNKNSAHLKPGTYKAVVSKDGFESSTQEVVVKEGVSTSLVSPLVAISADAQRWATAHQKDYLELEQKAGEFAAQEGQEFIEEYPLTKWLPLQKATYAIGYKRSGDGVVITIDAQNGYREAALQDIRDLGYDPSDYKIEFTNYRNPFDE